MILIRLLHLMTSSRLILVLVILLNRQSSLLSLAIIRQCTLHFNLQSFQLKLILIVHTSCLLIL